MVCWVLDCIQKKPGGPLSACQTQLGTMLAAAPDRGTGGVYPGSGVWRGRSISGAPPWYGSGTPVPHCFTEDPTVSRKSGNFSKFPEKQKFHDFREIPEKW